MMVTVTYNDSDNDTLTDFSPSTGVTRKSSVVVYHYIGWPTVTILIVTTPTNVITTPTCPLQ